jgi:hypothetical protein
VLVGFTWAACLIVCYYTLGPYVWTEYSDVGLLQWRRAPSCGTRHFAGLPCAPPPPLAAAYSLTAAPPTPRPHRRSAAPSQSQSQARRCGCGRRWGEAVRSRCVLFWPSLLSARCICSEMLLQIADARVLTAHLFPSIQAALLDPRRDPTPLVVLLDYSSFVSFGGKRGGISLLRSCVCTWYATSIPLPRIQFVAESYCAIYIVVLLCSITLGRKGGDPTMQLTERKGEPRSVPNLPIPFCESWMLSG